uniref:Uncharacterized protein n=1 Tax=Romanomermis culicivorax TaxID=13658 RepID=A0A915J8Q1_ROMCU
MFEQPKPQPVAFYWFRTCKQHRDKSTLEFLSRLRTLQVDCKYDNFNAANDLAYMLAQNCYSQDTQKQLFSSHAGMLDVYVNIMQAAESAESSSATIPGDLKDIHAIHDNSHPDSDRYLNHARDQLRNQSKPHSNNTEIAGLKGQFTMTIKYHGRQLKVTLLVLDMIKVTTLGTNTRDVL